MGKLTALVCPMDWGLGHASRCVPVIRALKDAGFVVVAATSGPGAALIKSEFGISGSSNDWLRVIPFPGFSVTYTRSFLFLNLLLQVPLFLFHIQKEKKLIRSLAQRYKPDIIISDNRYGLAHGSVKSIIITHQLRPSMPWYLKFAEGALAGVIRRWVRSFDECWIPDCPDDHASGKLTKGWEKLPGVYFIGWLSRFARLDLPGGLTKNSVRGDYRFRLMFILSGPEPQRSILEKMVIKQMSYTGIKTLLVRGLPFAPSVSEKRGELEIVPYLDSNALAHAASISELIVCRSGYSSVMDMLAMGKRAVLIPTPGQTEQEYLGRWLAKNGWFTVVKQKDLARYGIAELLKDKEQSTAGPPGCLHADDAFRDLLKERITGLAREKVAPGNSCQGSE